MRLCCMMMTDIRKGNTRRTQRFETCPTFRRLDCAALRGVALRCRGDCEFEGCGRVSAYASTADTRARFCHSHKEDGMVKVRDNVG